LNAGETRREWARIRHFTRRADLVVAVVSLTVAGTGAIASLGAVPAAQSALTPAPVVGIALTRGNVAFAVGPSKGDCDHAALWLQATKVIRFGQKSPLPCAQSTSTGQGIWDIAVARSRVIWLSYTGGNLRDWQLWTATPTKRTPKQLRFVERDVAAPPPIVVGPGTAHGVPFAVDAQVVYLGENGAPVFKTTLAAPVRLLAAGNGPNGIRVVAALSSGAVVALDATGSTVTEFPYPVGQVRAVRLTAVAVVVQDGNQVRFLTPGPAGATTTLPAGSVLVDVAQGRLLYARHGDIRARGIPSGPDVLLADGTPRKPARGQLEPQGFAWSLGKRINWRPGPLPPP
jgi:hypothetical protein